jgi:predicted RNA-binding protein with PUA-like domain
MAYWLMKSEPDTYGIDDLIKAGKPDLWEGCRNWTVRNFFRDSMKVGDLAFFYHSNIAPIGVIGIMRIATEAYPDPTQFDPKSHYYDATSRKEKPKWLAVDVEFVEKFDRTVTLAELKANPALEDMLVVRKGQRLSVMPVTEREWEIVVKMAKQKV